MPRLTHRRVTWFVLLTGCGFLLALAALTEIRGVGHPEYVLRLESATPLRAAGAEVGGSRESAEDIAAHFSPDDCRFRLDTDDPAGWKLRIFVTRTVREHGLPRRVDYAQERHVAVVAILADGRRVGTAVELPGADEWEDEPREVTVRLD